MGAIILLTGIKIRHRLIFGVFVVLINKKATILKSMVSSRGWIYDYSTLPQRIIKYAAGFTIAQPFCTIILPYKRNIVKAFASNLSVKRPHFYYMLF